jgi:acetyltransferase-like isoleucine patch superfamily enzyme
MMTSTDIVVPRETANDDVVKIVRWLFPAGAAVAAGATVVEIETSKSVVEIPAPTAGRLAILAAAGSDAPIGAAIGRLESVATRQPFRNGVAPSSAAAVSAEPTTAIGGPVMSRRAREKLTLHGLDETAVAHLPIVRESDIDAIIAPPSPPNHLEARTASEGIRPVSTPYHTRGLLGDARRSATDRGSNILALAWNYFWRNWLLGNLVRIAPVGIRNVLHRWRGVKMGRDCFIDPNAILETAYPENITLGDDVRITAGAIVMTHIKAPHLLRDRGYVPVVLKPVVLSSHCFIGVNAVVMPGVTVGEGAVVTSGSVVLSDVAPFTMVSGNPAKLVRRFGDA